MSSMYSVLLVQPYDTMGSVLIEYDVRVHPWVLTEGGSWVQSDSDGLMLLLKGLVSFFSLGRMGLKVKVHNPCRV
jgi:hypothetical protein